MPVLLVLRAHHDRPAADAAQAASLDRVLSGDDLSVVGGHSVVGVGGPAEILTIFDHHFERSHLDGT